MYSIQNIISEMSPIVRTYGEPRFHEAEIRYLLTDSRSLSCPECTLFFAICTEHGDGHKYIKDLYGRGVRAFVVEKEAAAYWKECPEAVFVSVCSAVKALQRLTAAHRRKFHYPVVGITGSNGKTIVKEWLYQLLSPDMNVVRSPRSYNSQIGVPLSVWQMSGEHDIALFEAGISKPGEMEALADIIRPTIGVFTGLGDAHQENFANMREKCVEKLRLFRNVDVLFYPSDVDAMVREYVHEHCDQLRLVAFSRTGNAVEDNMALCRAVCLHLEMDAQTLEKRMARLSPVAMRLEVLEGVRGCTLINDTYNCDLSSILTALDFMSRRPESADRVRTLLISDVRQTGMEPSELYSEVGQMAKEKGVTEVLAVGPQISAYGQTMLREGGRMRCFASTDQLLESGVLNTLSNRMILIKGARDFHFERVTDVLVRRMHETVLEVDLNAVVDNYNHYRSMLRPGVRMVCMVKADAYGAGAVEIARTLQEHRVDYLAVAVADEGVTLRKAGITTPIIVMNPEMNSPHTLFQYCLEPEVYSFRMLEGLIAAAQKEGVVGFPVHIKLDTGMHRLGFDPEKDMERLTDVLGRQTELRPSSVFSHFVGSDCDDFDTFSARQFELFKRGADCLQAAYGHHILRHICNSAGIEHFPERQLDMVRLGLGLYGINSRDNQVIHNVTTLKTGILQIHDVPAGDSIGYSRRTVVDRQSRIAAIPIGYADGLDRHLGNRHGYCMVNGRRAPYMGNICMDVCMIDVTDIPCEEGDQAVIFGEELPVTELSDVVGTIPYEILTGVSPRVQRVYFKD